MNSIAFVLANTGVAFVLALASILIVGVIARYAAGYFGSEKASRIAAFGVALGYALGHFPGSSAATFDELPALGGPLGTIAGIIAVWAWLLRKSSDELIDVNG